MRKNKPSFPGTFYVPLFALLLQFTILPAWAQSSRISGIVKDKTGNPVEGVSVSVKGVTSGTSTNAKGEYALDVANANTAILVFSFVGYLNKEELVRGRLEFEKLLSRLSTAFVPLGSH